MTLKRASLEILAGVIRVRDDSGLTHVIAFSADEGRAALKGLTTRVGMRHWRAIHKCLRTAGFYEVTWKRPGSEHAHVMLVGARLPVVEETA